MKVFKFNEMNVKQERVLVLTNYNLYNFKVAAI